MRPPRSWPRIAALGLLCGVAAGVAGGVFVYAVSELRLRAVRAAPAEPLRIQAGPELVERGRHLAVSVAQCLFCHGDDLAGKRVVDDPWLGRLYAPNLTGGRGGLGARYSDPELARAIRSGVARDGRSLLLMPSDGLHALSDSDVSALIAYLRSVPPVDREQPDTRVGPLTRAIWVAGLAPDLVPAERVDHSTPRRSGSEPRSGAGYGEYLVRIGACATCHHPDLAGGLHPLALPGEPTPPNLTPAGEMGSWSEADFARAMRSGVTPSGRRLAPEYMPWSLYAGMSDAEIASIWAYLRTIEPRSM